MPTDPGKLINIIIGILIGAAILAIPIKIAAKLVKANLAEYGWAFIAALLMLAIEMFVGYLELPGIVALVLAVTCCILAFKVTLGTSVPKAALIFLLMNVLIIALFAILFLVMVMIGGSASFSLFGHDFVYTR